MTRFNAPGTGIGRLGYLDEIANRAVVLERYEERAKKGRVGTHEGRKNKGVRQAG